MSLPHPHYQYIREFDFIYPIIFQTFNIQRMWPLLSPVCPQFILRSIKLPTPRHTVSHNQQCVWSTRPHWMISNRWATPQKAIHQINTQLWSYSGAIRCARRIVRTTTSDKLEFVWYCERPWLSDGRRRTTEIFKVWSYTDATGDIL